MFSVIVVQILVSIHLYPWKRVGSAVLAGLSTVDNTQRYITSREVPDSIVGTVGPDRRTA
jgi:hypothetical protein